MIASISIEDEGWHGVAGLEGAIMAAAAAVSHADPQIPEGAVATLLLTGDDRVKTLNRVWRGQDRPTNVLSFPAPGGFAVQDGESVFLGDVALAWGVVSREAMEQGKPVRDHACHLVVHGLLHLLGYDHEQDAAAETMEALETRILAGLGIPDPYHPAGML